MISKEENVVWCTRDRGPNLPAMSKRKYYIRNKWHTLVINKNMAKPTRERERKKEKINAKRERRKSTRSTIMLVFIYPNGSFFARCCCRRHRRPLVRCFVFRCCWCFGRFVFSSLFFLCFAHFFYFYFDKNKSIRISCWLRFDFPEIFFYIYDWFAVIINFMFWAHASF